MLNSSTPTPTLPTSDLGRAVAFYEGLGFAQGTQSPDGVTFTAGDGGFLVYESQYAGTNQATAMGFVVAAEEFDEVLASLRSAGLEFQTFEVPGGQWEGDVLVVEGMRNVWFADPDGNIVSVGTPGQ